MAAAIAAPFVLQAPEVAGGDGPALVGAGVTCANDRVGAVVGVGIVVCKMTGIVLDVASFGDCVAPATGAATGAGVPTAIGTVCGLAESTGDGARPGTSRIGSKTFSSEATNL